MLLKDTPEIFTIEVYKKLTKEDFYYLAKITSDIYRDQGKYKEYSYKFKSGEVRKALIRINQYALRMKNKLDE